MKYKVPAYTFCMCYNYISKDFWPGLYGAKYKYCDLPVYMIHPRDWQNVFVKTGIQ